MGLGRFRELTPGDDTRARLVAAGRATRKGNAMARHITTTAHATQARESAEQQILAVLRQLCEQTGLDLVRVDVVPIIAAAHLDAEPQQLPHAVRITLAV